MTKEEFLTELIRQARLTGWTNDYVEVSKFIVEVAENLGLPVPTDEQLEPYPYEDATDNLILDEAANEPNWSQSKDS